jgi:putative transposase
MVGSMGQVGSAADNAAMKSFLALLGAVPQPSTLDSPARSIAIAIAAWFERTYHRRRRQAALGRLTPIEFEIVITAPAARSA